MIYKNIIESNKYGIYLWGSNKNNVSDNVLFDNSDYNIGLFVSEDNTVTKNTIDFGEEGILLSGDYNEITENNISNHNNYGIEISGNNNYISENTIYNNLEGIHVEGFHVENSEKNRITFNIINNNDIGIYLAENSKCNTVSNNNFSSNGIDIQDFQIQGDCSDLNPYFLVIGMITGSVSIIIVFGILLLRRRSSRDEAILDDEGAKETLPFLRRYGTFIFVVLMSGLFILKVVKHFIIEDIESFTLNPDLYLMDVIAEITRFSDIIFVFLGAYALGKQVKGFKKVQLLKKVSLISCIVYILELPFFALSLLALPFIDLVLAFSLFLIYVYSQLGLRVIIAVSFLVVGFKNRANYGNYLISGAIMYLIYSVLYIVLWPIVQNSTLLIGSMHSDLYEVLTALAIVISYTVIAPFIVSLYSMYFLFFSIRMKNRYLMVWSILGLVLQYYYIYETLRYTFHVDIFVILLMLVIIIPSVVGIVMSMRFFELGKYFRKGMRVFISHSVDDFKKYRIDDIAKYLESQKEIGRVFYCEVDLSGNIDEWMQKIVARCHILLFISTEDSISSQDCKTELDLAKTNKLQIIPILGVAFAWDDLKELELHREFGTQFEPMQFENFCNELYENIMKFKKSLQSEIPDKKKKGISK